MRQLLGQDDDAGGDPVRAGMSCITGHESIAQFTDTVLPVIAAQRPAALWLFAPDGEVKPHAAIIAAVRALDPPRCRPRVFVQVGNVAAAREAVADGADVVVCQGIDAGGHQFRKGMGVVSLVPEVRRMLDDEFADRDVALVAAGGIVNGKGVAAALALGIYSPSSVQSIFFSSIVLITVSSILTKVLGADGVVMGTRVSKAHPVCPRNGRLTTQNTDGAILVYRSGRVDISRLSQGAGPPSHRRRFIYIQVKFTHSPYVYMYSHAAQNANAPATAG